MEVAFRSTRIRTFENSLVTIPNGNLLTANVNNYGARQYRRYSQSLHLALDTPADKIESFCEALRELVRLHPGTRKDFYEIILNDISQDSILVLVYIFWDVDDWSLELRARHKFLVDCLRIARRLGVELTPPTSKVGLSRHRPMEPAEDNYDREAFQKALERGQSEAKLTTVALTVGKEQEESA